MKTFKHPTILILVVALTIAAYSLTTAGASKNAGIQMIPGNFSGLAKTVQPGVVNIRTVKIINGGGPVFRHFFGNPFGGNNPFDHFKEPFTGREPQNEFKQRSLGSGFILDTDGYIVTNNHVIEKADEITVKLSDGREFDATVVGGDPNTDLALIKIKAPADLKPLKLGDSDEVEVGRWVVAIGSPFGLEQTVTAGIVSAKGRVIGAGPYDDFIQTDASINPGNSGGPLLNMQGEVIGINTAIIASGQGIGFAIPVNMAKGIIGQLKNDGQVTRGWMGVGIQDLTSELAGYYGLDQKEGVLVTQVYDGDPAHKAGIRPGDVILKVDGKKMSSSRELSKTIANLPVGKKTAITLYRDGRQETVKLTLAKRQTESRLSSKQPAHPDSLGLELEALPSENARRFGYTRDETGLLVTGVKPDGRAAAAGIRPGDLIKEVNRKPVASLTEFQAQLGKAEKDQAILMLLKRGSRGFVAVKIA